MTVLLVLYLIAIAVFCLIEHATLFDWPAGIVTGNLLASAIWAPLAVVHLDRLARKHHHEHMDLLHLQHTQMKAHVTAELARGQGQTPTWCSSGQEVNHEPE